MKWFVAVAAIGLAGCAFPSATTVRVQLPSEPAQGVPEYSEAERLMLQGQRELSHEQAAAAVPFLQAALAADPALYEAHYWLGYAYYQLGAYRLEILEYEKCLAINPNYQDALFQLATARAMQDQVDQACETFERLLALNPGHTRALYNLSVLEIERGNWDSSRQLLARMHAVEGASVR